MPVGIQMDSSGISKVWSFKQNVGVSNLHDLAKIRSLKSVSGAHKSPASFHSFIMLVLPSQIIRSGLAADQSKFLSFRPGREEGRA